MIGTPVQQQDRTDISAFRSIPLLAGLSDSDLRDVVRAFRIRIIEKGAILYRRGEPGGTLFIVATGAVMLGISSPDGRQAAFSVLGPGNVFGVISLFGAGTHSADASALVRSQVLCLSHDEFRPFVERSPPLRRALMDLMAFRILEARWVARGSLFADVTGRVMGWLGYLADRFGRRAAVGRLLNLPLVQQDLANLVGCSRESVNKALTYLARQGWVVPQDGGYLVRTDPD